MHVQTRFPVRLLDRRSYIDTITLVLRRAMPPDAFSEFRREAGRRFISRKVMHPDGLHWTEFLTLQQPTMAEMDWLRKYEAASPGAGTAWRPFFVVRVDVALDLLVNSASASALATRYVQRHIVPLGKHRDPWDFDPNEEMTQTKKSTLLNEREPEEGDSSREFRLGVLGFNMKAGVRTYVYGDLESKTQAGSYCVHIECRVLRKRALQTYGLAEIQQLLDLDHRAFWRKALKFVEPPTVHELSKVIRKRRVKNASAPEERDPRGADPWAYTPERVAHVVVRGHWDKDMQPNSHNLLLRMKSGKAMFGPRPQRLFTPMETRRLLPVSSRNALWDE